MDDNTSVMKHGYTPFWNFASCDNNENRLNVDFRNKLVH